MNPLSIQSHLNSLSGVGQLGRPELNLTQPPAGLGGVQGPNFGEVLAQEIGKVNERMVQADQAVSDLAMGKSEDVHGTIVAVQKAELEFKMLLEVRQKVLDAYQEVMRMQA
jgi:flagellar hook-basal body complex protein FliE